MNYKYPVCIAALLILFAFPASASMVSVLVVETGLNEEISSPQHSLLWESGLMEVFFDYGHIVTNNPITRMEKEAPREINGTALESDFIDAASGGCEYILLAFLEYTTERGAVVPVKMCVRLYGVTDRSLVYEQIFPAGTGKTVNDEYRIAQDAGKVIINHVKDR